MNVLKIAVSLLTLSLALAAALLVYAQNSSGGLTVVQTSPLARDLAVPNDTAVSIQFARG